MSRSKLEKKMDEAFKPVTMTMQELEDLCDKSEVTVNASEYEEFLAFKNKKEKEEKETKETEEREKQFKNALDLVERSLGNKMLAMMDKRDRVRKAIDNLQNKQKDILWKKHLAGLIAGRKYNSEFNKISEKITNLWKLYDRYNDQVNDIIRFKKEVDTEDLECPHTCTWLFN